MNTIVINQVGYKTISPKRAVLNYKADKVEIVSKKGVTEKAVSHFGTDEISGEDTYVADFSDITEAGEYYVECDGVKSASFTISENPYEGLMEDLWKCYYYLRCGSGLEEKFAGVYKHGKCHTKLAKVYGEENTLVDVSGGWHDAGDYGRYTTAGAVAVAHLLYGLKFSPDMIDAKFDIPKTDLPDILTEIKVELDFLMKMQRADGAAWHKVTTMRHADFIMPEEDVNDLFLFPVSAIAAADLSAVCALASTVYEKYDKEYANTLLEASIKSYKWLSENPEELLFHNPPESNTGEYDEAEDISNRYWAAAALYEATKDLKYKNDMLRERNRLIEFDSKLSRKPYYGSVFTCMGWAEVAGLGSLSYFLSGDKDDLFEALKKDFVAEADRLSENAKKNGYGLCMEAKDFIWGSNMELGKYMMVLTVANKLTSSNKYEGVISAALDYLLGCNSMDVSYITGNGEKAYKNPHLRPTAVDGIEQPWKGLVSGGPNRGLQDEKARELPKDTAPMKCFIDDIACYSLNEITIYWNSPVIFALAALK